MNIKMGLLIESWTMIYLFICKFKIKTLQICYHLKKIWLCNRKVDYKNQCSMQKYCNSNENSFRIKKNIYQLEHAVNYMYLIV